MGYVLDIHSRNSRGRHIHIDFKEVMKCSFQQVFSRDILSWVVFHSVKICISDRGEVKCALGRLDALNISLAGDVLLAVLLAVVHEGGAGDTGGLSRWFTGGSRK